MLQTLCSFLIIALAIFGAFKYNERKQQRLIEKQEVRNREIKRQNELLRQNEIKIEQSRQQEEQRRKEEEREKRIEEQRKRNIENYQLYISNIKEIPIEKSSVRLDGFLLNDMPEIRISKPPMDFERAKALGDFIVVDVETTGLSAMNDKIVEIAMIKFRGFEPAEYMATLINPEIDMPQKITEINGITNEMVVDCPNVSEIGQAFLDFVSADTIIVAHNIEFDLKFLYAHGIDLFRKKRKFYDTLQMASIRLKKCNDYKYDNAIENDRDYNYDVEDYKLTTLIRYMGIYVPRSHRAFNDCIATGALFYEFLKFYG